MGRVVALAGQVGGAKLAEGFYRLRGQDLAVIVNTGDDHEHVGLAFAPDLDTVLYVLAGIASPSAGWEPEFESHALFGMLKVLGGPDRPALGDKGLAAPILRSEGLRNERRLTDITAGFCRSLGVQARILPMSDDRVRTHVITSDGSITYHDYYHEMGCEPTVRAMHYAGADRAAIPDEVIDALSAPGLEAVVICPANPYHAIGPILAVEGMRELLRRSGAPVIAVTPIVGGKALKGSAGKLMSELGKEASARGAALEYLRLIDGFVIDAEDEPLAEGIRASGIDVMVAKTVMRTEEDRTRLAQGCLDFARAIRERRAAEAEA